MREMKDEDIKIWVERVASVLRLMNEKKIKSPDDIVKAVEEAFPTPEDRVIALTFFITNDFIKSGLERIATLEKTKSSDDIMYI